MMVGAVRPAEDLADDRDDEKPGHDPPGEPSPPSGMPDGESQKKNGYHGDKNGPRFKPEQGLPGAPPEKAEDLGQSQKEKAEGEKEIIDRSRNVPLDADVNGHGR
jgi:hypothetical protein